MATTDKPFVLRDIPLGSEGLRGRLLLVSGSDAAPWRFVFYRGTCTAARAAVAGCALEGLRDLHERRQDVERRAGQSSDLDYALGLALDLPAIDTEVGRVAAYLEAFPPTAPVS
jgi:hypothetical protein